MDTGGAGWALQTVIGFLVLIAVLGWAVLRNRRAKGRDRTEQATRDLYREEEAARDGSGDNVP